MANIKYAPMEQLSCWLEYRLVTDKLDPPVFRCRLRPVTGLNWIDGVPAGGSTFKVGRAFIEVAIEAIAEWDLAVDGVPLPLTAENKMGVMLPIISEQVEGEKDGTLLGIAIVRDAQDRGLFKKFLAFLAWWAATGWRERKEGGTDEADDEPRLEADDIAAWNFYMTTATPYVRDFGLMADWLKGLGMGGVAKSLFREKQSAIHLELLKRDAARAKKDGEQDKSEVVIEGAENG